MNTKLFIETIQKEFQGPFNPYMCMRWVFEFLVEGGSPSNSIALVGFNDLYRSCIVPASNAVQIENGYVKPMDLVMPDHSGNYRTHKGGEIRFKQVPNASASQVIMSDICEQHDVIVICGQYTHPNVKKVINNYKNIKRMYMLGTNNL